MSNTISAASSPIPVQRLEAEQSERWDQFVEQTPEASFFHLSAWKKVIEKSFGHRAYYLYTEQDGCISGVLPLFHVRSRLFGSFLNSLPFGAYGGVVAATEQAASALEQAACALASELGVGYLEMRNRTPRNTDWPTKNLYVTFRKELDPDPEKNFLAIPRKQRAMVRKGIKAGLECTLDEKIDCFYDIYSRSVHSLGTPVFSKHYFRTLKEVFGSSCEVLIVEHEGQPISTVMSFYFRDEVLPYYGAGTPEARRNKAFDFMYWDVMRRASESGIRIFDYGRSKEGTGSYRFKKHWGFTPEPLHYEYFLVKAREMPNLSPTNPRYHFFIEAWKRLPLPVTRVLGPMLARSLG
jgi:FemAB-related protein (PEP-CTERM system-associated)